EEYIKKIAGGMDEIKDVRSRVNTSRKGINIVCDVAILPGANIPEVTEKMQAAVKNKLSGMIGVEEKINIKMNINKIAKGPMEPGSVLEEEHVPHVPFREMS
ncbi:MAG: Asp23/Gls24 family envelope stress response protein, partial [Candidatus Omnitrophota bacterium]